MAPSRYSGGSSWLDRDTASTGMSADVGVLQTEASYKTLGKWIPLAAARLELDGALTGEPAARQPERC